MAFDCNDFNDVAAALIAGGGTTTDAQIRTALGRSYYSQYGHLRGRIEERFAGTFGEKGWHSQLCQVCRDATLKAIKKVGQKLDHLWKLRRDADYSPARDLTLAEAEGAVDVANDLKEKIRNLSAVEIETIQKDLRRLADHVEQGSRARNWS
jgi:hypothetical protein